MYIYLSHMGGLYTSDEPLDYELLYCEQCGDSDRLVGQADTLKEAWELLGPYEEKSNCEGCEYRGTDECVDCEPECAEWLSLDYVMAFLDEAFPEEKIPVIHLVAGCADSRLVYVKYERNGEEFPSCPCCDLQYAEHIAKGLLTGLSDPDRKSLTQAFVLTYDGRKHIVYNVTEKAEVKGETEEYDDNGWCGWKKLSEMKPTKKSRPVYEQLRNRREK